MTLLPSGFSVLAERMSTSEVFLLNSHGSANS